MTNIDVVIARARAVEIARAVLTGRASAVTGAIELNQLRASIDVPDDDPEFELFGAIDSECDRLPFGAVRSYWSEDALKRTQPEVDDAERWATETGREAFRRVIDRFAGRFSTC
jgi:hypothetical protein